MHVFGASRSILAVRRRLIARAVRSSLHAVMMLGALFSTGVLPAAFASGSNEVESSQQEGPSAEHATVHSEARMRIRRLSAHRCAACVVAQHTPTASSRSAQGLASSLSIPQLSLGLPLRLRC